MSASLLTQPKKIQPNVTALNRVVASGPMQRAGFKHPEMSAKRYAMNPNRLLADLLTGFESQFYRVQLNSAGISYESRNSNGPWSLSFDTINL